ncbi:hypothetical protein [Aquimarina sp. RZ0]|uniref:hypothetical protein n=1 Tax=Aquimarina sp. RZ0 TaxID=2607730 RepID=UPI0011F1E220|nr:hypothetical protein [Aquimarina sp. RZ0]KAA1247095.1 hypothetical protein F0000_05265 [Aquimarina sp. RZ0]
MDSFEKYIKDNKQQFDEHKVDSAKLWKGIESKLNPPGIKTRRLWQSPVFKVAAGILIIVGIFSLANPSVFSGINSSNQNDLVSQELNDIDTYYKGLVSFQVQLVKKSTKLQPEDKKEFLSFMEELDDEYLLLKEEMKENLNNEYILEAIIKNYKKRIELIENLLEQINLPKKANDHEGYIL